MAIITISRGTYTASNTVAEMLAERLGYPSISREEAGVETARDYGISAKELSKFAKKASAGMKMPVADACLACAERLLADGKKSEAVALYKEIKEDNQAAHIKAAAMKGILTAATKK